MPLTGLVTGVAGVPVQAPSMKQASRSSEGSFNRLANETALGASARAGAVGVMGVS
jgi:hypothetical protein